METQLILNAKINTQFPYLRYIMIIIFVVLFSFWAFPSQSSIGQTGKPGAEISSHSSANKTNADFLDEKDMRHLKQPPVMPALSKSALASKFIRQGSQNVKRVALTFDDGPYLLTEKYIQILQEYDVRATFFLIGVQVEKYPNEAKMIIDNGYEIGIHSYGHKQLTKMDTGLMENDFRKSLAAVRNIAEVDIRFFRPPFGDFNDNVIQTAKSHRLTTILWCVDPRDWQKNDPDEIAQHVLEKADNGAIILLHEGREGTLKACGRKVLK